MKSRYLSNSKLVPTLSACLYASVFVGAGCAVYDEELLRQPHDAGLDNRHGDAARVDVAEWDAAPPHEIDAAADAATTNDVSIADVDLDSDNVSDVRAEATGTSDRGGNVSDGTTLDASAPPPSDAGFDARDADAIAPPTDAARVDAKDSDAPLGPDAPILVDAEAGTADVAIDADTGGTSPPTFRVLRIGDGQAALSTASAPGFLEERTFDGALVGSPLSLPVATSGSQAACTFAGSAAAEGSVALSFDQRFVTMAGYGSPPGVDSIPSSDVARVVVRIDAAGTIDTSTPIGNAFGGGNVRGATSLDGTGFWVSGTGGPGGGIWYVPFGGGTSAHIVTSPDNVRWLQIVAGQLYASSGASPRTNVFSVGTGTPTAGAQSVTSLAGMPTSGMSPYAFVFFDRDAAIAGVDTLYLTDDRTPATDGSAGGIQKWTFDGSSWKRVATFSTLHGGTQASFRGLAAVDRGSSVVLVASTAESDGNRLVVVVDDGTAGPEGNVIAVSNAATAFRGIALSPIP